MHKLKILLLKNTNIINIFLLSIEIFSVNSGVSLRVSQTIASNSM